MPAHRTRERNRVYAGMAGTGGGMTLLAYVQSLPTTSSVKSLLMFAAPAVSVVFGAIWYAVKTQVDDWWREYRIEAELTKAQQDMEKIEADPLSSPKLRKDARTKYEALLLARIVIRAERIQEFANA